MKNNKVISFLLALVMAFGLWVYVTTVVNPEWENTYRNVAVTLSGESVLEENGLMLIMEEDLTVSVKLSGNRSDLNKINSNNLTITADLSKIKEPGTHQLSFSVVPPTDVPAGSVAV